MGKGVMNAYNGKPKQPATLQRVDVEVTRQTKALPPLPASVDASSEDEERIEQFIPDEGRAPTVEDAARQESEVAKLFEWEEEELGLVLEIIKEQESIAEHWEQENAQDERNRRNAPIDPSRMNTPIVVQNVNVNITHIVKYGPDYSRSARHYGPVHDCSQHRTHNETYTDHGQYVGTSDGRTLLRAPSLNGTC